MPTSNASEAIIVFRIKIDDQNANQITKKIETMRKTRDTRKLMIGTNAI